MDRDKIKLQSPLARLDRNASPPFPLHPGPEAALKYRFAEFEIDMDQQELRRGGEFVHVEPQVFDVILHLVRNHDRIVSKDELIDTVWHGRIISEAALSSRINAARK